MSSSRLDTVARVATPATSRSGLPWAFALNETATCDDIDVTLLALIVVDEAVRVSGLVWIRRRVDVGLSNVPTLSVSTLAGSPLLPVGGHLLPYGREAAWVSWLYRRPVQVLGAWEARIDRIDIAHRRGRWVPEPVAGPWNFAFRVPTSRRPLRLISRVD